MLPEQLAASHTEHAEQRAFIAYIAKATLYGFVGADDQRCYSDKDYADEWYAAFAIPALKWVHAIPNGGERNIAVASRLKAEGVKSGVADVFVPVAVQPWHGLYLEFKKRKGGRVRDSQSDFSRDIERVNCYKYFLVREWREGVELVKRYFNGEF